MSVSPTLRQQIRDRFKEVIAGKDPIDLKVVAPQVAFALRQDPAFCERFFEEFLQPVVYDVGTNLLTRLRSGSETQMMSSAQIADAIGEDTSRWKKWREYDPLSGEYVFLFNMTKEQGLAAATAREKRAAPDVERASLIRLAVGRLKPGQKIGDVWSEEELDNVQSRIIIGKPKISLGPVGVDMHKEIAA